MTRNPAAHLLLGRPLVASLGALVLAAAMMLLPPAAAHAATVITNASELGDLLADGGSGELTGDLTANGSVTVGAGKTVSLELNGHILTVHGTDGTSTARWGQTGLLVPATSTLTIVDAAGTGSLVVTGGTTFDATAPSTSGYSGGAAIISDGTLTAPRIIATGGGGGDGADGADPSTDNGGFGGSGGSGVANHGVLTAGTLTATGGAGGTGGDGSPAGPGGDGGRAAGNFGTLTVTATLTATGGAAGTAGTTVSGDPDLSGAYGGTGGVGLYADDAVTAGALIVTGGAGGSGSDSNTFGGNGGYGGDGVAGGTGTIVTATGTIVGGSGGAGGASAAKGGGGGNGGDAVEPSAVTVLSATALTGAASSGGAADPGGTMAGIPGIAGAAVPSTGSAVALQGNGASSTPAAYFGYASTVGDALDALPVAWPSRAGWTFTGWFTTASGGVATDPAAVPTGQSLYAQWTNSTPPGGGGGSGSGGPGSSGPGSDGAGGATSALADSGSDLGAWPLLGLALLLAGTAALAVSRRRTAGD